MATRTPKDISSREIQDRTAEQRSTASITADTTERALDVVILLLSVRLRSGSIAEDSAAAGAADSYEEDNDGSEEDAR